MASFHLSALPLSGTNLSTFRSNHLPVRCTSERQALFSRIAPVYDNLNDLLSLGQHRIWKRMAVSWSRSPLCLTHLPLVNQVLLTTLNDILAKEGDQVLDLCCGSGDLTFLLSNIVGSEGMATGLDFSKEILSVALSRQNLLTKACYSNIVWIEGDATDLPFSDSQFGAVTIGFGLRNVVNKRKCMQEVFRVLKPGSRVSVLDFNKSINPLTASFQEWMIDNVVVPVATSYGLSKEYEYLKSSIQEFLTGKELEQLALEAGFSDAKHYEVGGGIMGNLVATR